MHHAKWFSLKFPYGSLPCSLPSGKLSHLNELSSFRGTLFISLRNLIGLRHCKQLCLYSSHWLIENQIYLLWTNLLLKIQPSESPSRGILFFLYASWRLGLKYDYSMTQKKDKNIDVAWEKSLLTAYKGVLCFSVVCVSSEVEIGPPFSFLSFFPIKIGSKWESVNA